MGKNKNFVKFQANSWDRGLNSQRNAVIPPPKIKCCRCKKNKDRNNFSNKQQDSYLQWTSNSKKEYVVRCTECTDGTVNELFCVMGDHWAIKDDFAKTQRRNPDNAVCKECMSYHLTIPADNVTMKMQNLRFDEDEIDDGESDYTETTDNPFDDSASMVTNDHDAPDNVSEIAIPVSLGVMSALRSGNSAAEAINPKQVSSPNTGTHDSEWQTAGKSFGRSRAQAGGVYVGFDTAGYGQPSSSKAKLQAAAPEPSYTKNFARVKAYQLENDDHILQNMIEYHQANKHNNVRLKVDDSESDEDSESD